MTWRAKTHSDTVSGELAQRGEPIKVARDKDLIVVVREAHVSEYGWIVGVEGHRDAVVEEDWEGMHGHGRCKTLHRNQGVRGLSNGWLGRKLTRISFLIKESWQISKQ